MLEGLSSCVQEAKKEMCEQEHPANKNIPFPQNMTCDSFRRESDLIGDFSKMG
jgi:hypothetical protein